MWKALSGWSRIVWRLYGVNQERIIRANQIRHSAPKHQRPRGTANVSRGMCVPSYKEKYVIIEISISEKMKK